MLSRKMRLVFIFGVLFSGFLLGMIYQFNQDIPEIDQSQITYKSLKIKLNKLKSENKQLNQELQASAEDSAVRIDHRVINYSPGDFGLFLTVPANTKVSVTTYRYKGKIIVKKSLQINDYAGISVWHYMSEFHPRMEDFPLDLATFDGYENNTAYATLTAYDLIKQLRTATDYYITKEGVKMLFGYQYAPKTIGTVDLTTYTTRYSVYNQRLKKMYTIKPTIVRVWYSDISGVPVSKTDPEVIKAKQKLKKIVDQIDFSAFRIQEPKLPN
ncbi:MAG: hypothetical protein GXP43_01720 [bacterium]|nr:hypothetical protein [bacterium]